MQTETSTVAIGNVIETTDFKLPGLIKRYPGKVRDVYTLEGNIMVMITTDRISAFDEVLPVQIPAKGQILNQLAVHGMRQTEDIVKNHILSVPHLNVVIVQKTEPYMVEMVVRGYLVGHAWREYREGKRTICGLPMPDGMKENDKFPEPLITPTTKGQQGEKDEDISRDEILQQGLVSEADYLLLEKYTLELYQRGVEMAAERGLILVDTKYEFGKFENEIYLIDEIHTPDSSRYFHLKGYEERQANGENQKQLSKEFVREWLMENGFQGLEGQVMPAIPDEFVMDVTDRYMELFGIMTGEEITSVDVSLDSMEKSIIEHLPKKG